MWYNGIVRKSIRMGVGMIKWADNMYFSDGIHKNKRKKIMKSIENGALKFEVYCITFAMNTNNLFDIINVNELLFPYYQRKEIYIIGLANSREEAKELAADMLVELYNKTGDFKVREYF